MLNFGLDLYSDRGSGGGGRGVGGVGPRVEPSFPQPSRQSIPNNGEI